MKFDLIIITSPDFIPNESKLASALFAAGLKTLHVRKPGATKKDLKKFILEIPRKYHSRLVLHSHYSLAKEFNLKGIHLTEKTRKKKIPAVYDKRKHSLSASFHSTQDVAKSRRLYDYIFLSPVFESISKQGYKSAFQKEELHHFLSYHKNTIALGGIKPATLPTIQKMQFRGAATLGYIWQSAEPVKAFLKLKSKIK